MISKFSVPVLCCGCHLKVLGDSASVSAGHMVSVGCHTAGGPQTLALSPKTFKWQSQQNTSTENLEIMGLL